MQLPLPQWSCRCASQRGVIGTLSNVVVPLAAAPHQVEILTPLFVLATLSDCTGISYSVVVLCAR